VVFATAKLPSKKYFSSTYRVKLCAQSLEVFYIQFGSVEQDALWLSLDVDTSAENFALKYA
jgi:hypothetical protein